MRFCVRPHVDAAVGRITLVNRALLCTNEKDVRVARMKSYARAATFERNHRSVGTRYRQLVEKQCHYRGDTQVVLVQHPVVDLAVDAHAVERQVSFLRIRRPADLYFKCIMYTRD